MKAKPEEEALHLRVVPSMRELESGYRSLDQELLADAPFLRFEWLDALERTGCVASARGWLPHHLTLYRGEKLLAVAPAYLKNHSEGEFVFDFAWANAASRFGVEYYPKLLLAVPFTPATGPRLITAPGVERSLAARAFAAGIQQVVEQGELSSAHILFPPEEEAEAIETEGLLHRVGVQFHWKNAGFGTYEDFLATLPSKRRTQIRRERRAPSEQGVTITTLTGKDLVPEVIDAMFVFYKATVDKFHWGRRYLNRQFFEEVCSTMGDAIEIVLARDASKKPIAGAFNLRGRKTLFGRYWGATAELPFLHFNVCYYHSVERAILAGLTRFEPGAGGEHKLARGFAPTLTHSNHYLADPRFAGAIADFIRRERAAIEEEIATDEDSSLPVGTKK